MYEPVHECGFVHVNTGVQRSQKGQNVSWNYSYKGL